MPTQAEHEFLDQRATNVWLVELKRDQRAHYPSARGWALVLGGEKSTVVVGPRFEDPEQRVSARMKPILGDAVTAISKIEEATEAGYARAIVPNTTMRTMLNKLAHSGLRSCRGSNGRGLRFWLCAVFFLWREFIVEPKPEDPLPEKVVGLTRRCFKGGTEMESVSIARGVYGRLTQEGFAACAACESYIAQLRGQEEF
ncbi:hypothetical protein F5Y10DRAFT_237627 [Nemania abortiva]|nr:hypothetical protein F5Y10DRAFT_237627 [Nemania abortiva]